MVVSQEILVAKADLVAEEEILIVKKMEQRISNKIWRLVTTAERLDTQEICVINCTTRPPKLVSLLIWHMYQRDMFQVPEVYLYQMKSSKTYQILLAISGYTNQAAFIHCYLGHSR